MASDCKHDGLIWNGLCAECGADVSAMVPAAQQQQELVPLIGAGVHHKGLMAHRQQAENMAEDTTKRLIKQRKLVLILDLDKTLIHTTIDQVAEMWIRDGAHGIHAFQLGSHHGRYFTKIRPGLQSFLESLEALYEMHVYTMGTRAYAEQILKLIDPTRRFFSHRVLSKDESFDFNSKTVNLEVLFPNGDAIVAIVDDLPPVWSYRPNLVPALPYEYFRTLDEVNALPIQQTGADKAALQVMYESLPVTATIKPDESLLEMLKGHARSLAGSEEAVAYHLTTALRIAYEWHGLRALARAQQLVAIWQLSEAASKRVQEWAQATLERVHRTLSERRAGDRKNLVQAVDTAEGSAAGEGLKSGGKTRTATTEGRGSSSQAAQPEKDSEEDDPAAASPPSSQPMPGLQAAPTSVNWHAQLLAEIPQAMALMDFALQGMELKLERDATSGSRVAATGQQPATSAAQRESIFSYLACLRDQFHSDKSSSGELGRWFAEVLFDMGADATYEAIKSRVAHFQLLDAAFLLKVARLAHPTAEQWAEGKDASAIFRDMANSAPALSRVPFLTAPVDNDTALVTIGAALTQLHEEFFKQHSRRGHADTRDILPSLRSRFVFYYPWRLAGVHILFTGVIDRRSKLERSPLAQLALSMGATLAETMTASVTHVIMKSAGTDKQKEAMNYPGTYLVSVGWLEACASADARVPESDFAIPGLPVRVGDEIEPASKRGKRRNDGDGGGDVEITGQTFSGPAAGHRNLDLSEQARAQIDAELAEAMAGDDSGDEEEDDGGDLLFGEAEGEGEEGEDDEGGLGSGATSSATKRVTAAPRKAAEEISTHLSTGKRSSSSRHQRRRHGDDLDQDDEGAQRARKAARRAQPQTGAERAMMTYGPRDDEDEEEDDDEDGFQSEDRDEEGNNEEEEW